jgi:carbon-monoxide dehydrogenase iron sulfur subunit
LVKEVKALRIIWDASACDGCRICELACSFHHNKVFSPEVSDIKVIRNNRTADFKWFIGPGCDLCEGEPQPLCVKYCPDEALKKEVA